MNRTIYTSATALMLALVLGSGIANAQSKATPKQAAPAPAQSTTAPAPQQTANAPATARPAGMPMGGMAASSPGEAQAQFQQRVQVRQQGCSAKGRFYKWVPPHAPGDVNPRGGFFASYSNGKCDIDKAAVRASAGG